MHRKALSWIREPRMGKLRLMTMPVRALHIVTPGSACRVARLMVGIGAVVVAAACATGHGSQLRGASDACHEALGGRTVSAEAVMLGAARKTSPGGPGGFY